MKFIKNVLHLDCIMLRREGNNSEKITMNTTEIYKRNISILFHLGH